MATICAGKLMRCKLTIRRVIKRDERMNDVSFLRIIEVPPIEKIISFTSPPSNSILHSPMRWPGAESTLKTLDSKFHTARVARIRYTYRLGGSQSSTREYTAKRHKLEKGRRGGGLPLIIEPAKLSISIGSSASLNLPYSFTYF